MTDRGKRFPGLAWQHTFHSNYCLGYNMSLYTRQLYDQDRCSLSIRIWSALRKGTLSTTREPLPSIFSFLFLSRWLSKKSRKAETASRDRHRAAPLGPKSSKHGQINDLHGYKWTCYVNPGYDVWIIIQPGPTCRKR